MKHMATSTTLLRPNVPHAQDQHQEPQKHRNLQAHRHHSTPLGPGGQFAQSAHDHGAARVLGGGRPEPGLSKGQCQAHANGIGQEASLASKRDSMMQTQHKHCGFADLA
jgi:hypothetical protein